MRGGCMLRTGQCLLAEAVGCMEVGRGLVRAGINKKQKRKCGKLRQRQSAVLAISLVLSHLSLGARKPEHAYVPHPPRPAVPLNVQMQHKRNRPLSSHLLHELTYNLFKLPLCGPHKSLDRFLHLVSVQLKLANSTK
ncbi:hypothetical protein C8J57DRAFT_1214178 [Mycena rebaudengoi]|nr:hypothetical protein C8J57DRAFT_1214178 [Mycena rebaudengoi]